MRILKYYYRFSRYGEWSQSLSKLWMKLKQVDPSVSLKNYSQWHFHKYNNLYKLRSVFIRKSLKDVKGKAVFFFRTLIVPDTPCGTWLTVKTKTKWCNQEGKLWIEDEPCNIRHSCVRKGASRHFPTKYKEMCCFQRNWLYEGHLENCIVVKKHKKTKHGNTLFEGVLVRLTQHCHKYFQLWTASLALSRQCCCALLSAGWKKAPTPFLHLHQLSCLEIFPVMENLQTHGIQTLAATPVILTKEGLSSWLQASYPSS